MRQTTLLLIGCTDVNHYAMLLPTIINKKKQLRQALIQWLPNMLIIFLTFLQRLQVFGSKSNWLTGIWQADIWQTDIWQADIWQANIVTFGLYEIW
jgi:hypothetical protein